MVTPRFKLQRSLPVAFMTCGALLLMYCGGQYGVMMMKQRALERRWAEQQRAGSLRRVSDGLMRLTIPKIGLSAVVVEGTDREALLLGPGHLAGSAIPGGEGNSVITAHRDTFFRHIGDLQSGDTIHVQREGQVFTYQVFGKEIVKPTNMSVVQPAADNRLTLITCYPTHYVGPAPERLVVVSRLVGSPEDVSRASAPHTQRYLPGEERRPVPMRITAAHK